MARRLSAALYGQRMNGKMMAYNTAKVDEVVLALLHLTSFDDHGATRAWRSHDWDALDRLHTKGLISDPRSKAKSVVLSDKGAKLATELFGRYFGDSV